MRRWGFWNRVLYQVESEATLGGNLVEHVYRIQPQAVWLACRIKLYKKNRDKRNCIKHNEKLYFSREILLFQVPVDKLLRLLEIQRYRHTAPHPA